MLNVLGSNPGLTSVISGIGYLLPPYFEEQWWCSGLALGSRSKIKVWDLIPSLAITRLVISCFQVAILLKDSLSDVNPQNDKQTKASMLRYG